MPRSALSIFIIVSFFITLGSNSQEVSDQILKRAEELFSAKNFIEALPKLEQAVKIYKQQNDLKSAADSLYKTGVCYNVLSRYEDAVQALTQAEKIHSESSDIDALGFDMVERSIAEIFRSNVNEGLKICDQVLQIFEKSGNKKGQADALRVIAYGHISKGEYPKALEYTQRSLKIAQEIQDKQITAAGLKDEGSIYFRQGEQQKALDDLEKGLKIAEEIQDRRIQSQLLSNFALVYGEQGDHKRELENYEKAAKISEEIGDRFQQCLVSLNTGSTYFDMSQFQKAYGFIQKGTSLAEEIGNNRFLVGGLIGLGLVQFEYGDNEGGLANFKKALVIAEKLGDKFMLSYVLSELGWSSTVAGNYAAALEYQQRALQVRKEMDDKRAIAYSYILLGDIYQMRNEYDRAIQNYKEGLGISEASGILEPSSDAYKGLAQLYYKEKQWDEAEKAASKSIELSRITGNRDILSDALHMQSLIFRDTGKLTEALASIRDSVNVVESVRSDFDLAEHKAGYFEAQLGVYEDAIELMLKEKKIAEAFEYAQRSKARGFLDSLTEMRIDFNKNLDPELREKKEKLITEMSGLQDEIGKEHQKDNPDKKKLKQLQKKRDDFEDQYSKLILEIRSRNPQLAAIQYPEPTGLTQSQQLLDDQTVLMEYFVGKSFSVLFAITNKDIAAYDLPGDEKLSAQVSKIRDALQKPDSAFQISEQAHTKFLNAASELYSTLISPAKSFVQGKQRMIIAPDGALYYLPFECLVTKHGSGATINFNELPYLTREYDIQYVPSVSVLALFSTKPPQQKKSDQMQLLAFADPQIEGSDRKEASITRNWVGKLSALPFSRDEVKGIARLYSAEKSSVFFGPEASERNLKHLKLDEYRHLHFASHGLIDEEKPEFSALVLSPDPKGDEDGYLSMREVFDLKLNADLVVLSACKSGLGKKIRGEGLTGLARAFLCAGTNSVLVSLWNVNDHSTSDFMTNFYRNMESQKMNKAEALKSARLQMIRSKKYSHPYYWAPFVLIGKN
jgi:CHAT domain-containing protein/Tfp pilus assembly protein PilF